MFRAVPIVICQFLPLVNITLCKYNYMLITINTYDPRITIGLQKCEHIKNFKLAGKEMEIYIKTNIAEKKIWIRMNRSY